MRAPLVTRAVAERRALYPACMKRFRVPALSSTTHCWPGIMIICRDRKRITDVNNDGYIRLISFLVLFVKANQTTGGLWSLFT